MISDFAGSDKNKPPSCLLLNGYFNLIESVLFSTFKISSTFVTGGVCAFIVVLKKNTKMITIYALNINAVFFKSYKFLSAFFIKLATPNVLSSNKILSNTFSDCFLKKPKTSNADNASSLAVLF